MFYIVGLTITFFLSIILLTKRNKSKADIILAIWLLFIGIHLAFYYAFLTKALYNYPYLLGFNFPLPLVHGPFLYLYTSTLISNRFHYKTDLLHFIPYLLSHIFFIHFFLMSNLAKIDVFLNQGAGFELQMKIQTIAIMISGVVYVILAFLKLNTHKKHLLQEFSYTEKIKLDWLRYLIMGLGVIWLIVVLIDSDPVIFNATVVYVILLGYFGIKQVGIFNNRLTSSEKKEKAPLALAMTLDTLPEEPSQETENVKYRKSSLDEETAMAIHKKLTQLMHDEELYKDAELTLTTLAIHLNVHSNILSQVINSYENKNFYDFINDLRIDEFKKQALLEKNKKFTLLSIALECGFNSKTSFNRNFKKVMGITPTHYLKQNHITLSE
ncbi:MAG: helix-turn-helix domain-containing protein [Bacteroidota bacterium]